MSRRPPLHEDFRAALFAVAPLRLPYAEAWRMLAPIAERLRLPRPSYWRVRRFLIEEEGRLALRREHGKQLEATVAKILAGRVPKP